MNDFASELERRAQERDIDDADLCRDCDHPHKQHFNWKGNPMPCDEEILGRLVTYRTGVKAPDGYEETITDYEPTLCGCRGCRCQRCESEEN
jgi:hypothetical protein